MFFEAKPPVGSDVGPATTFPIPHFAPRARRITEHGRMVRRVSEKLGVKLTVPVCEERSNQSMMKVRG